MELKIILDFDGVLFNSAFEAYSVCNACTRDRVDFRRKVSFEEFLDFRSYVTDAWQYNRLYQRARLIADFEKLPYEKADTDDWAFSDCFFAARAEIMQDPDWPKIMSPYDFFFLLRPLLVRHPDSFVILSTRNVESIRQTMAFFGADGLAIFGQEDIRRFGSKIAVAGKQGWLEQGSYLVVYVDDMNAHLEPFEGKVHLPLHANWGYDRAEVDSLSQNQVLAIIGSMLKLTGSTNGDQI